MTMDKPALRKPKVFREHQFRAPSKAEHTMGLWVDRVGTLTVSCIQERLRILGQYCHIQILKGSGVYESKAAGRIPVHEGDCMIQFPEDPCRYYPTEQWTTCWVTWNGPEAKTLETLGYMNPKHPVFPDPGGSVTRAFKALTPIIHNEDAASLLRRKAIALEMVEQTYTSANHTAGSSLHNALMQRAVALIHKRFNTRLTLDDIAGTLNLSETHFRRLFHAYTGKSPTEFLLDIRIAEAKHLLLAGMAIKQVATAVGYDDLFYFMRVFRKSVGIPPGRFAQGQIPSKAQS